MDKKRKLTKNLSILGLTLQVLSTILCVIGLLLFINLSLAIIIIVMAIEFFVILIILAVKTTSIANRILFIIGIFIGLCAFIGFILELRISRKSNVSQNQENPQIPNNSNNTTNTPTMPQY